MQPKEFFPPLIIKLVIGLNKGKQYLLHLEFVDFHKAFDTLETSRFLRAATRVEIKFEYKNIIKYARKHARYYAR